MGKITNTVKKKKRKEEERSYNNKAPKINLFGPKLIYGTNSQSRNGPLF